MGKDDLERLAAAGERARDDAEQKRDRRARWKFRARRSKQERLLDNSLGIEDAAVTGVMGCLALAGGGAALAYYLGPHAARIPLAIAIGVLGAGAATWVYFALTAWKRRNVDRWFAAMPFELDKARYLADLRKERASAVITMTLTFAATVPDTDRTLLVNAAIGAAKRGKARFTSDRALELQSPRLDTYFIRTDDKGGSGHSNRRVHKWVGRCIERGLPAIHRRHAISRVDITIG